LLAANSLYIIRRAFFWFFFGQTKKNSLPRLAAKQFAQAKKYKASIAGKAVKDHWSCIKTKVENSPCGQQILKTKTENDLGKQKRTACRA
jgi:hypothetical protein